MAPLRVPGYPRWHLCGYRIPATVPGCAMPNGKTSTGPDAWSLSGLLSCADTRRQRGQCDQNRGLRKAPPGRGRRPRARPRPHTGYGSRGPGVAAHPPTPLPRRVPPADSLRAALGIYEDRRAKALADRVRAGLASLTAQPGRRAGVTIPAHGVQQDPNRPSTPFADSRVKSPVAEPDDTTRAQVRVTPHPASVAEGNQPCTPMSTS